MQAFSEALARFGRGKLITVFSLALALLWGGEGAQDCIPGRAARLSLTVKGSDSSFAVVAGQFVRPRRKVFKRYLF